MIEESIDSFSHNLVDHQAHLKCGFFVLYSSGREAGYPPAAGKRELLFRCPSVLW